MDVKERLYAELEKELDVMLEPVDDVEAFLNCARYNEADDGQLLREYLERHPTDVDARDGQGRTAMHMAAANGHMAIMEMLFEFNPTPDIANVEGNTALHFAALNNRVEAALRLIQAGWKASATNAFNRTALQLIQGKRFEQLEALLLEHDDSLDSYKLPSGATVSMGGAEAGSEEADSDGEGVEGGERGARAAAQAGPQTTRPAPKIPAKAAPAPARAVKKPEGGVLGTSTLDDME